VENKGKYDGSVAILYSFRMKSDILQTQNIQILTYILLKTGYFKVKLLEIYYLLHSKINILTTQLH